VVSLHADCDADAVLAQVRPAGPACHTGAVSCFDASGVRGAADAQADGTASGGPPPNTESAPSSSSPTHHSVPAPIVSTAHGTFSRLATTIAERQAALPVPDGTKPSYTQRLLSDRNLRLKKLGEEATELAVACADGDRARAVEEGGDVIYHTLVALAAIGVSVDDVAQTLEARAR
jgi:phosphoribosyl-ATP pyrophosphohydrolase/phosphoribosyl-AMP cyclohydrolase